MELINPHLHFGVAATSLSSQQLVALVLCADTLALAHELTATYAQNAVGEKDMHNAALAAVAHGRRLSDLRICAVIPADLYRAGCVRKCR